MTKQQLRPPLLSAPSGEVIPKWDMTKLEKRSCIVCGCNEYTVICYRPDRLEVGQCSCCTAFYLPAVPGENDLLSRNVFGRRVKGTRDILTGSGDFMLSQLARKDE